MGLLLHKSLMNKNEALADRIAALGLAEGKQSTGLVGVEGLRFDRSLPRCPVVYTPSIVVIAQGRKIGFLGEACFVYDADQYLVLSVPMPFECETHGPLLGLSIDVDPQMLGELILAMDDGVKVDSDVPGIASTPLTDALHCTLMRLTDALASPLQRRVLGPQIVREVLFHVLSGPQGGALRALANRQSQFSQIARSLALIHTDYANELSIESLAEKANMSLSSFHLKFKMVTSHSPIQYLKNIRLHKARLLMLHQGLGAGAAAQQVGYESQSQFSREFKRLFGAPPRAMTK